ncbi:hypothetical protein J3R83DRAFT_5510 [Lanmaoa asiatica]|nr:hypothetical protein J3R83DRAFT_5510 [Lanmaoa asiatica]
MDSAHQMAFQAAYFGLYGRTECTYEPAITKAFLHGQTEAIQSVQLESVEFTKSQGLGQDRHLYVLYCLYQRQLSENPDSLPDDPVPSTATTAQVALPSIFVDPDWNLLGTSIGNPAPRLFGFGPVTADGYGIGYIIKENGIIIQVSFQTCALS